MATSLENGIAAAKAGNKSLAMEYLKQAVTEDSRNVTAWLWVSSLLDNPEKKRFCFQKVLEVDPNNKYALQGMKSLVKPSQEPTANHSTASTQSSVIQPQKPVIQPQAQQLNKNIVQSPQRKSVPSKKPSANINIGTIFKIIGLAFLAMIIFGLLASSEDAADFGLRILVGFYILWALSGYYGAWLLIKKGHGLGLGGCAILAGGAPLLLPLFLGGFMYLWGKTAKDKYAAPETYLVCPNCQQPTSMKSAFCSHCGKPIPTGNKKHR